MTTNRTLFLIDIAETPIMFMSPQPKEKETNLTHYFVKLMKTSVPFAPRKGNTLPSVSHAVNRFNEVERLDCSLIFLISQIGLILYPLNFKSLRHCTDTAQVIKRPVTKLKAYTWD